MRDAPKMSRRQMLAATTVMAIAACSQPVHDAPRGLSRRGFLQAQA